jgi:hypothetical protein
LSDA